MHEAMQNTDEVSSIWAKKATEYKIMTGWLKSFCPITVLSNEVYPTQWSDLVL